MFFHRILKLALAIIFSQLAGIIGSVFTFTAISGWYTTLAKPVFTPPNFVFGPVWITLYTLMGIALFLIWDKEQGFSFLKNKKAYYLFLGQWFLNALWSIMFFGFQLLFLAFLEIIVLWILIALTMFEFYKIDKKAAYLLIPYLAWVTVASILNLSLYLLNGA